MSKKKKIYTVKRGGFEGEEIKSFSSFLKAVNYIDTILLKKGIEIIVVKKDNGYDYTWIYKDNNSNVAWAKALTNRGFINKAIYRGIKDGSLQGCYIITSTEVF